MTWTVFPSVPDGHWNLTHTPGSVTDVVPQSKHDCPFAQTFISIPVTLEPVNELHVLGILFFSWSCTFGIYNTILVFISSQAIKISLNFHDHPKNPRKLLYFMARSPKNLRLSKIFAENVNSNTNYFNWPITLSNSYYIVCSWTRKFWHASSGVAARSMNRISAFMNKQYSNCFSQREIILADHFYTLLQLFSCVAY